MHRLVGLILWCSACGTQTGEVCGALIFDCEGLLTSEQALVAVALTDDALHEAGYMRADRSVCADMDQIEIDCKPPRDDRQGLWTGWPFRNVTLNVENPCQASLVLGHELLHWWGIRRGFLDHGEHPSAWFCNGLCRWQSQSPSVERSIQLDLYDEGTVCRP